MFTQKNLNFQKLSLVICNMHVFVLGSTLWSIDSQPLPGSVHTHTHTHTHTHAHTHTRFHVSSHLINCVCMSARQKVSAIQICMWAHVVYMQNMPTVGELASSPMEGYPKWYLLGNCYRLVISNIDFNITSCGTRSLLGCRLLSLAISRSLYEGPT